MVNFKSTSLSWMVFWMNAAMVLPVLFFSLFLLMVIINSATLHPDNMEGIFSGFQKTWLVYVVFFLVYVPLSAKFFLMTTKLLFLKLLVAALMSYFIERVISLHLIASDGDPYYGVFSSFLAIIAAAPVIFIFTLIHYALLKRSGERFFKIERGIKELH